MIGCGEAAIGKHVSPLVPILGFVLAVEFTRGSLSAFVLPHFAV